MVLVVRWYGGATDGEKDYLVAILRIIPFSALHFATLWLIMMMMMMKKRKRRWIMTLILNYLKANILALHGYQS